MILLARSYDDLHPRSVMVLSKNTFIIVQGMRKILIILIVILLPVSILTGLNMVELRAEEPRRAVVAMEMVLSGEYVVPHINGAEYYNKPPLFNWLMAAFFEITGSFDEWVVRLPSLLSFLLIGLIHFLVTKKYLPKQTAIYSALIFLTSADIFFYATINAGEIDLFFSLLVYLQVMSVFVFHQQKKYLWMFLASYFFTALGVLTKGPPSLAFQAITVFFWLVYNRQFRMLFSWKHFAGILLLVLMAGGYFYAYDQKADAVAFMTQLFKEASQRTGAESNFLQIVQQSALFPLKLLQLLAPWSLLAVFLFRKNVWNEIRQNKFLAFCLLFFVTNIPLYWFTAELRNRYIYMFFPFVLTIIAYFFNHELAKNKIRKIVELIFGGAIALSGLAYWVVPFMTETKELDWIWIKCIVLFLLTSTLFVLYIRFAAERILLLILSIVVLRFGLAMIYFPALRDNSKELFYRHEISNIVAITKDEQIFLSGEPYVFLSDASIGPLHFEEVTLQTAPLIAYQITYYITKANGKILQYEPEMQPGKFYLINQPKLNEEAEIFYSFTENWMRKEMLLVKIKTD